MVARYAIQRRRTMRCTRAGGSVQITVDGELLLTINLDIKRSVRYADQAVIPIDELLGYIIDCHFSEPDKRHMLHASVRETRLLRAFRNGGAGRAKLVALVG